MNIQSYMPSTKTKRIGFIATIMLALLGVTTANAISDNNNSISYENTIPSSAETEAEKTNQQPNDTSTAIHTDTNVANREEEAVPATDQVNVAGSNNSSSSISLKIDSKTSSSAGSTDQPQPGEVSVEINGESVTPDSRGRIRERAEDENSESSIRVDIDDDSSSNSDITFDISVESETKDVRR